MAENKEEEINLVLEDPKEENIEIVPAETAKIVKPDEGIETLRASLAAERAESAREKAARIDAENRARVASEETGKAKTEIHETNLSSVTIAIASAKQTGDVLETHLAQAMQDMDFAAAAKIQRQMTDNSAHLRDLERGKVGLDQHKPTVQERYADPVEQIASQLSPRSAAWVRAHPEYARDQRLLNKMVAAHNLVSGEVEPDSDAYFDKVENLLGLKLPGETPLSDASAGAGRLAAPAAAPVSRGGGGNGSGPATVTLSLAEREMAKMMDMSEKEYALNKLAIEREKGTMQ